MHANCPTCNNMETFLLVLIKYGGTTQQYIMDYSELTYNYFIRVVRIKKAQFVTSKIKCF